VEEVDGERADQRGLLGRLGDGGIASGERSSDRADEDGEREVPGADAGPDAAAVVAQFVGLARGSRKLHGLGKAAASEA
jgi:hypothetical protein